MDKLSYSLGLNVGYSYLASGINKLNVEDFAEGVRCVLEAKEPAISIDEAKQIINEFLSQLQAEAEKAAAILHAEAIKESKMREAEGEAEYMRMLAAAYDTADKKEFYEFTLALDALKQSLNGEQKTVILDGNSELAKILLGGN